jgi:hypothetical protein
MIHEHEALELASAAIDFGLTPDLERELTLSLRECPVCAERAAGYQEQIRLMRRLPVLDASEATRRRVTQAALGHRVDRPSRMLLLVAAALLLGLTLAVSAAVGAFLRSAPPPLGYVDGSALPSSQPSADATTVAAASPSAGPPVGPIADLAPDTIVEVVSGNLRVRSEPRIATDSVKYEPLLVTGDRLIVIKGPVAANDYEWYLVAPINTEPDRPAEDLPIGWVSRGDHDGTPWIDTVPLHCPAPPVDLVALSALHAYERVACFGSQDLSFLAYVRGGPESGWQALTSAVDGDPSASATGPLLGLDRSGSARASDLPDGAVALLEGGFDRTDRLDCPVDDAEDPALAELRCRSVFVVNRASPAGGTLAPGTAAVTVTDDLRVRTQPVVSDESGKLNLLDLGTRAFVLAGPVIGSGYAWYQVAVPSITAEGGPLVGWVAAAGKDGEPWLGPDRTACPATNELTFEQFAPLAGQPVVHGGIACFGRGSAHEGETVTVDAFARMICLDEPWTAEPNWLLARNRALILSDGERAVTAVRVLNPDALPCNSLSDLMYRFGGHFDDPSADECVGWGDTGGPGDLVTDVGAIYLCRTTFVVETMSPYPVGPGPTPPPTPAP